jgi:hypothetical protein
LPEKLKKQSVKHVRKNEPRKPLRIQLLKPHIGVRAK